MEEEKIPWNTPMMLCKTCILKDSQATPLDTLRSSTNFCKNLLCSASSSVGASLERSLSSCSVFCSCFNSLRSIRHIACFGLALLVLP